MFSLKSNLIFNLSLAMILMFCVNAMAVPQIHKAARTGDLKTVVLSIEAGDDVNSFDQKYGHTPLCFAALRGDVEMAKLLLKKGALIETANIFQQKPLHVAVRNGKRDMVEFLISQGAQVNAITNKKVTPLHLAVVSRHLDVVKLLIEKGASVNMKDRGGNSPLSYAVRLGDEELINILKSQGAE